MRMGTDIVSVARFHALIGAHGDRFVTRWFTAAEIEYCSSRAEPSRHFAARYAAKEAVVKALPGPWSGPLPWRDIEIRHRPGGAPEVVLHGPVGDHAGHCDVAGIELSLSHCDEFATATALVMFR